LPCSPVKLACMSRYLSTSRTTSPSPALIACLPLGEDAVGRVRIGGAGECGHSQSELGSEDHVAAATTGCARVHARLPREQDSLPRTARISTSSARSRASSARPGTGRCGCATPTRCTWTSRLASSPDPRSHCNPFVLPRTSQRLPGGARCRSPGHRSGSPRDHQFAHAVVGAVHVHRNLVFGYGES
jgi:hypothetical protein